MDIIFKGRGQGKTTELINLSERTGAPILVANLSRAKNLIRMALSMNKAIPMPLTLNEYFNAKQYGLGRDIHILIDDADDILQSIFYTVSIDAISLTKTKGNGDKDET